MRWHYIGDNEYPQEGIPCLCEINRGCVKLMQYCGDGLFVNFMDFHGNYHLMTAEYVFSVNGGEDDTGCYTINEYIEV